MGQHVASKIAPTNVEYGKNCAAERSDDEMSPPPVRQMRKRKSCEGDCGRKPSQAGKFSEAFNCEAAIIDLFKYGRPHYKQKPKPKRHRLHGGHLTFVHRKAKRRKDDHVD